MSQGPSAGAVLLAIFLILFGLCFLLLGGGCTIFWIWAMFQGDSSWMAGSGIFVVMSVVTLAVGVLLLWVSVKLLRGTPAAVPPPVPRDDAATPDPAPPTEP